jgi:glutathione S-transferase
MAKLILHGPDYSTHVRTIRLCLHEKKVDYELKPLAILRGEGRTPEHLRLHPFARVPVIEHDGFTLYETLAISHYIDDVFEGVKLQPADKKRLARMRQMISILDSYGHQPIVSTIVAARAEEALRGVPVNAERLAKAVPAARHCLAVIDRMIGEGPFATGNSLTLADLHLAPTVGFFARTPEGTRMLPNLPKLAGWWERMAARPSVVATDPYAA